MSSTTDLMRIHIAYFASLAEAAGCAEETVQVVSGTGLTELYQQLDTAHHFDRPMSDLRVAINDHFASWDDAIHDGDSVVFITPVAGG